MQEVHSSYSGRRSIKYQLFAITVGINLVLTTLLSVGIFIRYTDSYQEDLKQEIETIAQLLAYNQTAPLQFSDLLTAKELLESLRAASVIHRAYILDQRREIIVEYTGDNANQDPSADKPMLKQIKHQEIHFNTDYFYYAQQIRIAEKSLGMLVLKTSMEQLNQRQHEFAGLLLFLSIVSIALAAILSMRLQYLITMPIRKVAEAAADVAQGKLETRVDVAGNNEVTALSRDFNLMVSSLQASTVSKTHMDNVIASLPDALFLLNQDFTIDNCNPAAVRWTGRELSQLAGLNLFDLLAFDDDKLAQNTLSQMLAESGSIQDVICQLQQHPSSPALSFSFSPLNEGEAKNNGYVCIGRDISERINYENQLQRALEVAQSANEAKSTFLSRMSHELRTPLNAILGFAQLQQLEFKDPNLERFRAGNDEIIHAGFHLLNLINDILDLVHVEQNQLKISMETCSLDDAITASLKLVEILRYEKSVKVNFIPCEAHVYADFTRLKQVLINLLSNAFKYNKEKGEVWINVVEGSDNYLRIEITDEGVGIKDEELTELFKPFSRLKFAMEKEIPGTGIGLSLCRFLVEQMNGRIGVTSQYNKGSTFWFELQKSQITTLKDTEEQDSLMLNTNCSGTVLYIEDNPSNQMLMRSYFDNYDQDLELIMVSSGEEGIELTEKLKPQLVIIDINLPKMSGIEVVKHIRPLANSQSMRLLALSANAMPSQIENAMKSGFDNYITKPLKIAELNEEVQKVFG